MYQVSLDLSENQIQLLEDVLYEIAPSNWYILQNRLLSNGKLEGFFEHYGDIEGSMMELNNLCTIKVPFESSKIEKLKPEDWTNAYKFHFKPWSFKNFHWIPLWEKNTFIVPEGEKAFYIDPSVAFGTGTHETTKLCLQRLVTLEENLNECNRSVLDVGCGSGIIAITAKLLGFSEVLGVDNDLDAIRVSRENACVNNCPNVEFEQIDLADLVENQIQHDLIFANIQADVLVNNSENLIGLLSPQSHLILSGILANEAAEVEKIFEEELKLKFKSVKTELEKLNEWVAIIFELSNP